MLFPVCRRIISFEPAWLIDVLRLLVSGKLIHGDMVEKFIQAFCQFTGMPYAIATQSGRTALWAALRVLDLPSGSEVILPAYEDLSVLEVILELGLVPVFADVDPSSGNVVLGTVARVVTDKTRVIIVAHIFGNPCPMEKIQSLAREKGICLIEDCAHAMGTYVDGRHAGNWGDMAIFSFYTTKPFMCFGGGMVATRYSHWQVKLDRFAESLEGPGVRDILGKVLSGLLLWLLSSRMFFPWTGFPVLLLSGRFGSAAEDKYLRRHHLKPSRQGRHQRMANVQGCVGLVNLGVFPDRLARVRQNALLLDAALSGRIPRTRVVQGSSYYFYIILTAESTRVRRALLRSGLDSGRHVMRYCPDHYRGSGNFPNARMIFSQSVQIPIYEELCGQDIKDIAGVVNAAFGESV